MHDQTECRDEMKIDCMFIVLFHTLHAFGALSSGEIEYSVVTVDGSVEML